MIYFDNAYRTLGASADITRIEARTVVQAMKMRSRMSAVEAVNDPLGALEPVERTEEAVRDAFNALSNVRTRLEARLLWFSSRSPRDAGALACMQAGDWRGAIGAWSGSDDSDARANLARLYHVLLIAADVRGNETLPEGICLWSDVARTWSAVAADERFWQEFAITEAAGGFEPVALGADVAKLREGIWGVLLGPSAELLGRLVGDGEYGMARDHLDELEVGGLAPAAIAMLEREGFASFMSGLDAAVDDARLELGESATRSSIIQAYRSYRSRAVPMVADILTLAGFNFEPSKLACRKGATFLAELVQAALQAGANALANALYQESEGIAAGHVGETIQPDNLRTVQTVAPTRTSFSGASGRTVAYLLLLVVGAIVRAGTCNNSGSSLPYYDLSRPNLQTTRYDDSLLSEPDLSTFYMWQAMDTMRIPGMEDSVPIIRLSDRVDRLGIGVEVYGSLLRALLNGVARRDSILRMLASEHEGLPPGDRMADSLFQVRLQASIDKWKEIAGGYWAAYAERYARYRDSLKAYNVLARLPSVSARADTMRPRTEPPEYSEVMERNREMLRRWVNIVSDADNASARRKVKHGR